MSQAPLPDRVTERTPEPARPWPAGAATGVGSLPGEDVREALRLVLGELPDLPHLPELPARGPSADLLGRGLVVAGDLPADLQPSGWRLVARPGIDARRGRDLLDRDLDALEELAGEYAGPFKVQVAGPWTLAAGVELPRGGPALADRGAVRDVVAALADGLPAHLSAVRRRIPRARLLLQLDEPTLPAVLAGRVRTASGFGAVAAVEPHDALTALRTVVATAVDAGVAVVAHCCAGDPPLTLLADAGAAALSVDAAALGPRRDDEVGELVERGVGLFLGLVPALGPGVPPSTREVVAPARALWGRLGFPPERLTDSVVVTPTCGLAGASQGWVRTALRLVRQAARVLAEGPEVRA